MTTTPTAVQDGLTNVAANLGTDRDKATSSVYQQTPLTDQSLLTAYRNSWVCRKAIEVPVDDATRKWRSWEGGAEDVALMERMERGFRVRRKVRQAMYRARLFGGAGILIGVGDEQEWREPLEPEGVGPGDLKFLTVLDRHYLIAGERETDPREENFNGARYYDLQPESGNPVRVHPSRIAVFIGNESLQDVTASVSSWGWGDSVLQAAFTECMNLDATMANIASLVFEAKTDVVGIDGLAELLKNPQAETLLVKRMQASARMKGNNGTWLKDANETFESRSFAFGGLADISDRFMQIVSGAVDVPMTRFLAMAPAGMSSTGESDMRNYHDRIQSDQENIISPAIATIDEVLIRSAGIDPSRVKPSWRPLRQMDEQEESEVMLRNAEVISKLALTQLFGDENLVEAAARLMGETALVGMGNDEI